jgi:transposase
MPRKAYTTDVSDEEWGFVAPYPSLLPEASGQRRHSLREVFNGLRYVVKGGVTWRLVPNDLPPWEIIYQQTQRWLRAGVFEAMTHDLRVFLRQFAGRKGQPSAVIIDSRTLRSTPESGSRAGYDGAKRKKGSKIHIAVDTLGHLLAAHVTSASEQDRAQVGLLSEALQQTTGESVELAFADQGYTGEAAASAAMQNGIQLQVIKLPQAKRGFVLLPRRWVVERSFAWATRFRPRARLRAPPSDPQRPPLRRLRMHHARKSRNPMERSP